MTLIMIMTTISITTHSNTRVMRNTLSTYNYERETYGSSQHNNEDNSIEHEEVNEGLLCEEDETDTLFDDGLEQ